MTGRPTPADAAAPVGRPSFRWSSSSVSHTPNARDLRIPPIWSVELAETPIVQRDCACETRHVPSRPANATPVNRGSLLHPPVEARGTRYERSRLYAAPA